MQWPGYLQKQAHTEQRGEEGEGVRWRSINVLTRMANDSAPHENVSKGGVVYCFEFLGFYVAHLGKSGASCQQWQLRVLLVCMAEDEEE